MPELPEVEVVRRGVQEHAVGRTVASVVVYHPRAIRRHHAGGDDFVARLNGRYFTAARRRGKYLWIDLDGASDQSEEGDQDVLLVHLGMSGQLLVELADAPTEAHLRVVLSFADGGPGLRFVDQRTFGGMAIDELVPSSVAGVGSVPRSVAHIALDPLDSAYRVDTVVAAIRRRRTGIKRVLLDQRVVSGIGNIYADEALWRASVHGNTSVQILPPARIRRVLSAAAEVMTEALAQGGTSFDALYVNVNGASGYFARSLAVYGQEGEPCRRCGALIRREAFMNRSSFSCPRCQPLVGN